MKEAFPGGSVVKNLPANAGDVKTRVQSLGQEDLLEKEMEAHSSIFAWQIPQTKKPGRLQSMGITKDLDMTEQLKSNNIHEKNPEKLNNSQKWPKPSI